MVFDGEEDDAIQAPRQRVLQGRAVNFDSQRGVSQAAFRDQDGLNYVLTGDVDEDVLGNIIQASFRH
jgi:hypothetical protein